MLRRLRLTLFGRRLSGPRRIATRTPDGQVRSSAGATKSREEHLYLLLIFVIGTSYTYGTLMNYPLYTTLVQKRNSFEAPAGLIVICFGSSKLIAQLSHLLGQRLFGRELLATKVLVTLMYGFAALGLLVASLSGITSVTVLLGFSSLNFISSRVLGGTLFASPSEEVVRRRIFVYDMAGQAGPVWLFTVGQLFQRTPNTAIIRFFVLIHPLAVCLVAWWFLSPAPFFSSARMKAEQAAKEKCVEEDTRLGGSLSVSPSCNSSEVQWPWTNARFRVIAVTWCLNWWSFNFYAYNIFPVLISKVGPQLSIVSLIYTAEGLTCIILMSAFMPFLKAHPIEKFFLSSWALTFLAPLGICWLGRVHWTGYILTLYMMDFSCSISNLCLGSVLLRTLPWELTPVFFSHVSALGGIVCAVSFIQIYVAGILGWEMTAMLGHAGAIICAAVMYMIDRDAVSEIWNLCDRELPPSATRTISTFSRETSPL